MGDYLKAIAVGIFVIIGFGVLYELYLICQQLQYLNQCLIVSIEQLAALKHEIATLDLSVYSGLNTYGIEAELGRISDRLYKIYYMMGGRGL